jgi:hypothetical protein
VWPLGHRFGNAAPPVQSPRGRQHHRPRTHPPRRPPRAPRRPLPLVRQRLPLRRPRPHAHPAHDRPRRLQRPLLPGRHLLSRHHGSLTFIAGGWGVEAHKTAYLDGVPFEGLRSVDQPAIVRFGRTIFLLVPDVGAHEVAPVIVNGRVVSAATRKVLEDAARASRDGRTLLILAPTGAGKEDVARHYHQSGPRAHGPFVVIDSPTLKGNTAEATLFGARRGAFTDAVHSEGLLASAEKGTAFIDELGDMELRVQASMLRAIQERTIMPVGSTTPRRVNFALVAATQVDLEQAIKDGRFREDLMGRLEQRVVTLDGLDRRRAEIPLLIELIAKRFDPNAQIDATFVEACLLASWPRNIRQLEAVVDNAASAAKQGNRAMVASDVVRPSRPSSIAPPPFVPAPVIDNPMRAAFVESYRRHGGEPDAV